MHFIYLLLHPEAETRYRIHLYSLRMKNNFYPVLDIRNERLHSHCFPVTESHPRVFVSQESWELPHSFFATKSWEINGGESTDTRGKRIILAGRDARARRVQRKLVEVSFLRAIRDAFAWETRASRLHTRNSHNKWRNESLLAAR